MSESKHTPGPWAVDLDREFIQGGDVVSVEALTPDRRHVVREVCSLMLDTGEDKDGEDWPEDAANALLIAAAPDFYEACKAFASAMRADADFLKLVEALRLADAAVARAEGGGR